MKSATNMQKECTKKSKKNFRNFLCSTSSTLGFGAKVDSGVFAKNVVVGNPATAEYIFTAHYDTPPRLPKFFVKHMLFNSFVTLPLFLVGVGCALPLFVANLTFMQTYFASIMALQPYWYYLTSGTAVAYVFGFLRGANKTNFNDNSSGVLSLLNIMEKLKDAPQDVKDKVCFVFTDNEEKGLFGAFAFKNKYKKVLKNQKFINFDCVGRGKQINAYYASKNAPSVVDDIKKFENSNFIVAPKRSTMMSMSDHIAFRKYNHATLLCVDKENNKSLYSQIHSSNDTELEDENIDYITSIYSNNILKEYGVLPQKEKVQEEVKAKSVLPQFLKNLISKKKNLVGYKKQTASNSALKQDAEKEAI